MVPMGRVQVICDFRNYNYWTGNAIGFRASRELCSNFLVLFVPVRRYAALSSSIDVLQKNLCKRVYYFVNVYLNKNHMSETKQNYDGKPR